MRDSAHTGCFFIRTFGCQMNVHDSEHIAGVLVDSGYSRAASIEEASVVIFNTCCVRQGAEDRVWGNLSMLAADRDSKRIVAICGCMAQRHGVEIFRRFPIVRLVFGLDALARLPELLESSRGAPICDLGDVNAARIDELSAIRKSGLAAWVPISHGCDNMCAYCVVPSVRGAERSREPGDILSEIATLTDGGVLEVTLLGQNVNTYGRDLGGEENFAWLLQAVGSAEGMRRVKFETSHPRDLGDDILKVMAEADAACEYLHLPVQSGSNRVLEAMNRGYTREYYMERASRARKAIGGVALSTDIIVGFPGETQKDFEDTLDLVKTVRFDAAYMFLYSPREGTSAFGLEDDVPLDEKRMRFAELEFVQSEITRESLGKIVGSDVEVLVEGVAKDGRHIMGRTRDHRVVVLPADEAQEDTLVRAVVCGAGGHSLRGSVKEVIIGPDEATNRHEVQG